MAEILTHTFVNPKVDSADGTVTSSGEWNDGHTFGGGADGQYIVKDSGQAKGARWTPGPKITDILEPYTGTSPSPGLASTVVTYTGSAVILIFIGLAVVTSSAAQCTVSLRRDGVEIAQLTAEGSTGFFKMLRAKTVAESAGTHTYTVVLSVGGGATIITSNTLLVTLSIGS